MLFRSCSVALRQQRVGSYPMRFDEGLPAKFLRRQGTQGLSTTVGVLLEVDLRVIHGVAAVSGRRRASCPPHDEVGGLFSDFEPCRGETAPRNFIVRWPRVVLKKWGRRVRTWQAASLTLASASSVTL